MSLFRDQSGGKRRSSDRLLSEGQSDATATDKHEQMAPYGDEPTDNKHLQVAQHDSKLTTEELVQAAQRGDDQAFHDLMQLHQSQLYRIAFTYMRHELDALEVVQETVCRALIHIKKLRQTKYVSTWLVRILLNVCADELKRRGRQSPESMERLQDLSGERVLYSQDDNALTVEDRLELEQAIDQLSEQEKQIILLKYYEDMTITNISEVLDCPSGTIKTRLHRALRKLRDILGRGGRAHG